MGRSSGHRKSPSSVRLIPSVRVINLVKKARLRAKVELKGRKSHRRPTSPEGPLVEDVEDEDLPAGTKMTDSWIEELKVSETLGEWSELVGNLFSRQDTFKELGLTLLELISRLPTPLGRFTREYCDSARPHRARRLNHKGVISCPSLPGGSAPGLKASLKPTRHGSGSWSSFTISTTAPDGKSQYVFRSMTPSTTTS